MGKLIGYKNNTWRVVKEFNYTGSKQTVSLSPGEYLFVCHGAKGGAGKLGQTNYGGSAYGIITLTQEQTFYVMVGGDGEAGKDQIGYHAFGGFNGGGKGGSGITVSGTTYTSGSGGGGATDIRLVNPDDTTTVGDTTKTLLSRIMVAGGGGGAIHYSGDDIPTTGGFGGGEIGGPILLNSNSSSYKKYATQTTGYKFGIGEDGIDNPATSVISYSAEGVGGGGGGWFGGYAPIPNKQLYDSANGSGGSGYILTQSSYKPENYMDGYNIESFYFHDTLMDIGSAENACCYICTKTTNLIPGDVITYPSVGESCKTSLLPGKYKLKCNGASGSVRYQPYKYRQKGGYSEGILTLTEEADIYSFTGGSPLLVNAMEDLQKYSPSMGFNGSAILQQSCPGGAASDFRLVNIAQDAYEYKMGIIPVEYITSIAHNPYYYDTHIKPTSTTKIEIKFSFNGTNEMMFGVYSGASSTTQRFYIGGFSSYWCIGMGYNARMNSIDSDAHVVIMDAKNKKVYLDGVDTPPESTAYNNIDIGKDMTMLLFDRHVPSGQSGGKGNIYYLKIWEDDVLISDLRPGITVNSNIPVFYDLVKPRILHPTVASNFTYSNPANTNNDASFNSRIIVAGGSGGQGSTTTTAGDGGGTTGGEASGGSGTNNGPGTQTSSPSTSDVANKGSFGYGGISLYNGYSYPLCFQGSGGSGWFGGSATTYTTNADTAKAGAGGSGYVLTNSSYKPSGYLDGFNVSSYYLTNASTTRNSSTVPTGHGKNEIEVLEINNSRFIIKDESGYKRYVASTDSWVVFKLSSQTIGKTDFDEYGVITIKSFNGLSGEIEVLMYSEDELETTINIEYAGKTRRISTNIDTKTRVKHVNIDADYTSGEYSIDVSHSRISDTRLHVDVDITQSPNAVGDLKLYAIQLLNK